MPHQVGHERQRSLEHADEGQLGAPDGGVDASALRRLQVRFYRFRLHGRCRLAGGARQLVDQANLSVLEHQGPEIAPVEQLDPDFRVQLPQAAELAVLLAHQALLQRRKLHVKIQDGQIEVRREALQDRTVEVPQDREHVRLVLPADLVEVEDAGELLFAGVSEGRTWGFSWADVVERVDARSLGHAYPTPRSSRARPTRRRSTPGS